jgi:Leucine-rich repeat (LRR) protein
MDISARPPGTARRCRRTSRPPRSPWRGRGRCWTRSATRGRGVRSSGDAPESLREVTLAAAENRIADLWPLADLTGLQVLLLDRNQITDVGTLSPLAGLVNLGLSGNRIADLWPLAGLDQLRRLDLSGNAVADVSALGDVSGLVWLRLLGNPVSNALPLGRLAQLRWFWLDSGTVAPR